MSENPSRAQSEAEPSPDPLPATNWRGFWPQALPLSGFSCGELIDRLSILYLKLFHCRSAPRRQLILGEVRRLRSRLTRYVPHPALRWRREELLSEHADKFETHALDPPAVRFHKLGWLLLVNNYEQWGLEDRLAELIDERKQASEPEVRAAVYCRMGELFEQVRYHNQRRTFLRDQINQLFPLGLAELAPADGPRCATDIRVYSSSQALPPAL